MLTPQESKQENMLAPKDLAEILLKYQESIEARNPSGLVVSEGTPTTPQAYIEMQKRYMLDIVERGLLGLEQVEVQPPSSPDADAALTLKRLKKSPNLRLAAAAAELEAERQLLGMNIKNEQLLVAAHKAFEAAIQIFDSPNVGEARDNADKLAKELKKMAVEIAIEGPYRAHSADLEQVDRIYQIIRSLIGSPRGSEILENNHIEADKATVAVLETHVARLCLLTPIYGLGTAMRKTAEAAQRALDAVVELNKAVLRGEKDVVEKKLIEASSYAALARIQAENAASLCEENKEVLSQKDMNVMKTVKEFALDFASVADSAVKAAISNLNKQARAATSNPSVPIDKRAFFANLQEFFQDMIEALKNSRIGRWLDNLLGISTKLDLDQVPSQARPPITPFRPIFSEDNSLKAEEIRLKVTEPEKDPSSTQRTVLSELIRKKENIERMRRHYFEEGRLMEKWVESWVNQKDQALLLEIDIITSQPEPQLAPVTADLLEEKKLEENSGDLLANPASAAQEQEDAAAAMEIAIRLSELTAEIESTKRTIDAYQVRGEVVPSSISRKHDQLLKELELSLESQSTSQTSNAAAAAVAESKPENELDVNSQLQQAAPVAPAQLKETKSEEENPSSTRAVTFSELTPQTTPVQEPVEGQLPSNAEKASLEDQASPKEENMASLLDKFSVRREQQGRDRKQSNAENDNGFEGVEFDDLPSSHPGRDSEDVLSLNR
jgi:hypothetical protein